MTILVIDGQGGGIGKRLIETLAPKLPENIKLVAIGTNSIATSVMLKAGANAAATGENPVVINCADADIIAGPLGIILANAMYGEITPSMAQAVGASNAQKILIPTEKCGVHVAGTQNMALAQYIEDAVQSIITLI